MTAPSARHTLHTGVLNPMNLSPRRFECEQIPIRSDGEQLRNTVRALLMLVVSSLCAPCVWAGVLNVGPIVLTGSGSFYSPDGDLGGSFGTAGVTFAADGSTGTDSVSITVAVNLGPYDAPPPSVGSTRGFSADTTTCLEGGFAYPTLLCNATIDGISGVGAFSGIGSGGVVQVFALENLAGCGQLDCPSAGALLAQAEVYSYLDFTSVTGCCFDNFDDTFVLLASVPQPIPEPSTGGVGFIGVAVLAGLCLRKRGMGLDNATPQ